MNLFPNDEQREEFGCKEVPTLRLSLVENNEIKYTIIFDTLTYYYYKFQNGNNYLHFKIAIINDKDYAVLVSKKYDKYIVETRNYWRSAITGEDTIIETPAQIYKNFSINYQMYPEGDPARWEFIFDSVERGK